MGATAAAKEEEEEEEEDEEETARIRRKGIGCMGGRASQTENWNGRGTFT